jgi:phosphate uptake regulator
MPGSRWSLQRKLEAAHLSGESRGGYPFPRMAEITQSLVKDVLDAFVNSDSKLARPVCERDDLVDGLNDQYFENSLPI